MKVRFTFAAFREELRFFDGILYIALWLEYNDTMYFCTLQDRNKVPQLLEAIPIEKECGWFA